MVCKVVKSTHGIWRKRLYPIPQHRGPSLVDELVKQFPKAKKVSEEENIISITSEARLFSGDPYLAILSLSPAPAVSSNLSSSSPKLC